MRKPSLLLLCIAAFNGGLWAQLSVHHLLCENKTNPIGIEDKIPRFSWQLGSEKRGVMQTAYEIRVGKSAEDLVKNKNLAWSTGKIASDASVFVPYTGNALESGNRYHWQVRVWDNQGNVSAWSAAAFWQTGLLNQSDWAAKWIKQDFSEDTTQRPALLFRKTFSTKKKISAATLYATAHGVYEARLNGQRIGDAYLTPGWTVYPKRLQYQAFDVTAMVKNGANALGVTLGSGWYRGYLGWSDQKNIYGKELALLCQMVIQYADGTTENVNSDETWQSSTGQILSAEIYHGEVIDARLEKTGWDTPQYEAKNWAKVTVKDVPKSQLVATENEGIKKRETFKPQKIFTTPKGEKVIDFGQNLVGWVVMKARGNAGEKITLQHAEVLDKEGNFYTTNLRSAKAQAVYILRGGAEEVFEPHFTFFGFRYLKIEGLKNEPKAEDFTAVALYSDMKPTGSFTTSNPLINQLQSNIQWGQKGNFLDVPTDCPQRDERMGWTGDAQAFARTATFNLNVHNFFSKWLKDVAADQLPNGSVPFVIPNVLGVNSAGSTGWADVATIAPWHMYLAYGDKRILENQYASMKAWVEFMRQKSKNDLWNSGFHFGDWLFYDVDDDREGKSAITDKYLIAQCFYAHSTQLLINAAQVLGKNEDVTVYSDLLKKIKEAFQKEYMTPNGRLVSSSQTAYTLALHFDMLPENMRSQAADRLVQNVKSYNHHITTGFLGTPYICHVLSRFGHDSTAYKLLLQETYPSWLYPVKMGATTIWERWDGIKPDGTFQTPGMNSYNHYAYGAIGDWLYRVMAGIDTDEKAVGYKHIIIKPHIGGGFKNAAATLETYYGKVVSNWKNTEGGAIELIVEIPNNTTATIHIPSNEVNKITESGAAITAAKDIKIGSAAGGYIPLEIGSGKYSFRF